MNFNRTVDLRAQDTDLEGAKERQDEVSTHSHTMGCRARQGHGELGQTLSRAQTNRLWYVCQSGHTRAGGLIMMIEGIEIDVANLKSTSEFHALRALADKHGLVISAL